MGLNRVPDLVLVRVLSFLSIEDLEAIGLVCRKIQKFAALEITKQLQRRFDWRLDYIRKVKFGKEISPFLVRRLFERSKSKKSTFTQRRTQLVPDTYPEITEVSSKCYSNKF